MALASRWLLSGSALVVASTACGETEPSSDAGTSSGSGSEVSSNDDPADGSTADAGTPEASASSDGTGGAGTSGASTTAADSTAADSTEDGSSGGGVTDADLLALQAFADENISGPGSGGWTSPGYVGDSVVLMYDVMPGLDGLMDLHTVYGDVAVVEVAVAMAMEYIEAGTDLDGDGWDDWVTNYAGEGPPDNHAHYEWRAGAGIGTVLRHIHADAELSETFAVEKAAMTAMLETQVWDKWDYPSGTPYTADRGNWNNTNVTEQIGRLGQVAIALHQVTGSAEYGDWIEERGADLIDGSLFGGGVGSLEYDPVNDAYNIRGRTDGTDVVGSLAPGSEDVSHAQDVVAFMTTAYFEGYTFQGTLTPTVMQRLTNTITQVIWPGTTIDVPTWNDAVDGSSTPGNFGRNNGGWARLSCFDEALHSRFVAYVLNRGTYDAGVVAQQGRVWAAAGLARCGQLLLSGRAPD